MQTAEVSVPLRAVIENNIGKWTLVEWLEPSGSDVHRGQRIALIKCDHTGAVEHIVAPRAGKLVKLKIRSGDRLNERNKIVAVIEFCPHSVLFKGICAFCGVDVDVGHFAESISTSGISVGYNQNFLTVSRTVAESISASTADTLLKAHRLALVLDLDHTLVHATTDPLVPAILHHSPSSANLKSVISLSLSERQSKTTSPLMYLKLRPSLEEFLSRVASKFQLHIYTMGSRPYADQVAHIIDPDKTLFHGRVTCREDFEEGAWNRKSIERLFPCDDSLAVVVDDREDVWISESSQLYMPNLVRAAPYFFWDGLHEVYDGTLHKNTPSIHAPREKYGFSTPKHPPFFHMQNAVRNRLAIERSDSRPIQNQNTFVENDESRGDMVNGQSSELQKTVKEMWDKDSNVETGRHLLRLAEILEECHRRFFEANDSLTHRSLPGAKTIESISDSHKTADVKKVLSIMRFEVLKGCTITFTGVVPIGADPTTVPLWNLTKRLGAVCLMNFVKGETTHVVVAENRKPSTQKCEEALKSGCTFVVTIKWLEDSAVNFERREEFSYRVHTSRNSATAEEYKYNIETNFAEARALLLVKRPNNKTNSDNGGPLKKPRFDQKPLYAKSNAIVKEETTNSHEAVLNHGDESELSGAELEAAIEAVFGEEDV